MGHYHHNDLLQNQVWNGPLPPQQLTAKPSLEWAITTQRLTTNTKSKMGQYHHNNLITTKPSLEWDITTTKSGMGHCHHKGLLQKQTVEWDITITC